MRLTSKLLGWLTQRFSRAPDSFLAFRLRYDGSMQWTVADGVLSTVVTGGSGVDLSVDLASFTLVGLVGYLAGQTGYTVVYADGTALSTLSALVLVDGSGDPSLSNGDHFYGFTSLLYGYMDTAAAELTTAAAQIPTLPLQMSTTTATGEWLDLLGSYYVVPRLVGEADAQYAQRIISTVLLPKCNNVALEAAIAEFCGQTVSVVDVVNYQGAGPYWNGAANFDGSVFFNSGATAQYGLFDVAVGYDLLNGLSITGFTAEVQALVAQLRSAGTQLRALALTSPAFPADAVTTPTDLVDTLTWNEAWTFNGAFNFDGSIVFSTGSTSVGTIEGNTAATLLVGVLDSDDADGIELEQGGGALLLEGGGVLETEQ